MTKEALQDYSTGVYWFKLQRGEELEWVVGRLLQSRLIEYPNGLISPAEILDIHGPIGKLSQFRLK